MSIVSRLSKLERHAGPVASVPLEGWDVMHAFLSDISRRCAMWAHESRHEPAEPGSFRASWVHRCIALRPIEFANIAAILAHRGGFDGADIARALCRRAVSELPSREDDGPDSDDGFDVPTWASWVEGGCTGAHLLEWLHGPVQLSEDSEDGI